MKAVIAVYGKDTVGILAKVTGICAEVNANVLDVSQTIMQEQLFVMTMIVDIDGCKVGFEDFASQLKNTGAALGLEIHVMHENIFNSMHRI